VSNPVPQESPIQTLSRLLDEHPVVEFAVLVGSRANDTAHAGSDWDIAISWSPSRDWFQDMSQAESLRIRLAAALGVPTTAIDLIDLRSTNLAMRAAAAEEGTILAGDDSPAWARFLRRTWRELEDFEWERRHAA
jgi:predicted nucleotidyltransferase